MYYYVLYICLLCVIYYVLYIIIHYYVYINDKHLNYFACLKEHLYSGCQIVFDLFCFMRLKNNQNFVRIHLET